MHILTKILVVFAALLAVALSALTIAYTANAERVAGQFNAEVQARQRAEAQAAAANTTYQQGRLEQQREIDALQQQLAQFRSAESQYRQENARLLADSRQAQSAEQSIRSKIDQLAATNETLTQIVQSYRNEVQGLRSSELRFVRTETELADRISDLTGQLEVAVENNRAMQEQLQELRDQIAGMQGGGPTGDTGTIRAAVPIQARVTEVRRGPAGETLVQINAGASDQLRQNMELSLVRGNEYLGKVILQVVDTQASVGRVDFQGRTAREIRSGDTVLSVIQ